MTPEIEPSMFGKLLDWIVGGLGAMIAVIYGVVKSDIKELHNHTIRKDVFSQHVENDDRQLTAINDELSRTREINAKIFDQMRDMEKTTSTNHAEILRAIGRARQ